jgi:hypothetical protein
MQNVVADILDENGGTLATHQEKASAFLHSFKNKMRQSQPTSALNLSLYISVVDGMDALVEPSLRRKWIIFSII